MNGLGDGTEAAGLSLTVGTGVFTGAGTLHSGIFRFEIVILNFPSDRLNTACHVNRN